MDPQEHFLIISAGDSIHKTYPAVLEELRTVTHTIIFAEKEVYTNSARDDARKRMWKCSIRNAVDEVNAISISRTISCALVTIDAATFDAIRDPVLGIFSDHPDARYSFDISAGPKRLSLGLFSMSLWVEGDCYYAFGNSPARRVPVPTLPIKYLPTNPHNLVILTILFREQEQGKKSRAWYRKQHCLTRRRPGRSRSAMRMRIRPDMNFSARNSPAWFQYLPAGTLSGWRLIRRVDRKSSTASPRMASWPSSSIQPG